MARDHPRRHRAHVRRRARGLLLLPHALQRELPDAGDARGRRGRHPRGPLPVPRRAEASARTGAQILASGTAMLAALEAQAMLRDEYDVAADVWSATSYKLLREDALEVERWNRLHPDASRARAVRRRACCATTEGPIVAVTDFMKACPGPDRRRFVPEPFIAARHRRLRLLRHARRAAPPLRGRRAERRRRRAREPRRSRRDQGRSRRRRRSPATTSTPTPTTPAPPDVALEQVSLVHRRDGPATLGRLGAGRYIAARRPASSSRSGSSSSGSSSSSSQSSALDRVVVVVFVRRLVVEVDVRERPTGLAEETVVVALLEFTGLAEPASPSFSRHVTALERADPDRRLRRL